ncbi:hypothetical protein [Litoreibacter roseus]|uniref:PH domain-containing protein n=1 Tax=Litoreibacter roseus TaxID=2601869 RepID=A0A6N6JDN7_9RHOB|nr:hypothetical protein [Litoreibacter roseus]GFE63489.1 hypothetical protein KIN_05630 [Litoreibacter roseus]
MSDIITGMTPSAARRVFGTGVLLCLGGLLLYLSAAQPPAELHYLALLLVVAAAILGTGYKMWISTAHRIELTETELRLSDGTIICRIEDIKNVDRGFFAFKPSNGFLLTLNKSYPRSWAPGLWWRVGRRVGVGGITPGAQGKIMADSLAAMVAQRDGEF